VPRLDSQLESQGAEFLVLGALLTEGVVAYKSYTNTPGYDLIATNPARNTSCRIQIKSRWATDYDRGFLIKNLDSEFVVFVALNRGYRYRMAGSKNGSGRKPPEFYVFPTAMLKEVPRSEGWGKLFLRNIKDVESYANRWDLIATYLEKLKP
jgi:hypothetical protein